MFSVKRKAAEKRRNCMLLLLNYFKEYLGISSSSSSYISLPSLGSYERIVSMPKQRHTLYFRESITVVEGMKLGRMLKANI